MIIYKAHGITIGEEWFNLPQGKLPSCLDILQAVQMETIPSNIRELFQFYTTIIDLTQVEPILIGACNETTRYEIKHANLENNLLYKHDDSIAELEKFALFYDKFAKSKNLLPINISRLKAYLETGHLLLTSCLSQKTNTPIVYHAYYYDQGRARLLNSASFYRETMDKLERKQIGMANRWLHWQDILYLKEQGTNIYDFGGWYNGKTDEEKIRINQFKQGFGGTIIKGYNYQQGLTIKGKLYLAIKKIYDFIRH